MKITLNKLMSWGPCKGYTEEKILEITKGRKSLTPLEVAKLTMSAEDRILVLLRPEVLGEKNFVEVVNKIADRAVKKYCLECEIEEVEIWAKKWLSGEDRDYATAKAAALAAEAAVWALWATAKAAACAAKAAANAVVRAAMVVATCAAKTATWTAAQGAVRNVTAEAAAETAERRWQLNLIKKYL